ncbi:MAG: type IV pilin N-terminal domain-containing protein [Methanocorpusculum sp.]|nr:type IV pilin N-terminal domain-containing protein [Methanocorpusculum sp.]
MKEKDSAVSPVIGIMLLLAMTIIAAGVLAAFAGGIGSVSEPTPSVDLSVSSYGSGDNLRLLFEQKSGNGLTPSDIKVSFLVKNPDKNDYVGSFILTELTDDTAWTAGEILTTKNIMKTSEMLGITVDELKAAASVSTPVEIKIYHLPSSTIIYQSTILLEET